MMEGVETPARGAMKRRRQWMFSEKIEREESV